MVSNENKEKKKRNEQNRTRNQSLNFHVSPAERKLIERRIELSGLDKATFFIESCLYQKILVKGNIKSFDKIKKRLDELEGKLSSPAVLAALDDVNLETIRMILEIMDHLYGGRKERK
ncbi:MAG: hypothetical protein IJM25_09640 [Eubacterium sp.]|nr:hypothetical protein [Eubacterium sp.]